MKYDLPAELRRVGLTRHAPRSVDGRLVDNSLNLDHRTVCRSVERCARTVIELAKLSDTVGSRKPDLILPVGGRHVEPFARGVARTRGIGFLTPGSLERLRAFDRSQGLGEAPYLDKYSSIVLIGAAIISRGDTGELLQDPYIAERATGLVAIWDRGIETERPPLPVNMGQAVLIQERLPDMLNDAQQPAIRIAA